MNSGFALENVENVEKWFENNPKRFCAFSVYRLIWTIADSYKTNYWEFGNITDWEPIACGLQKASSRVSQEKPKNFRIRGCAFEQNFDFFIKNTEN